MHKRDLRFAGIVALFAALNVGGWVWARRAVVAAGRDEVRVVATLPGPWVDEARRVALEFDRDLAREEELGLPLAAPPFRFEPQVAGHWEWSAPRRLSFLPDRPLPPGRLFRAVPSPRFATLTGHRLGGPTEFAFRTRSLSLVACTLESADDDSLTLALTFNQPVAAHDVAARVEVEGVVREPGTDGPVAVEALTERVAERILLHAPPALGDSIHVRVRAGLRGPQAELGLEQDHLTSLAVPRAFGLLGARAEPDWRSGAPQVELRFSSALDAAQTPPRVTAEPPVEGLRAWVDGNRLRLDGPFRAGLRYALRLEGPLLSAGGKVVPAGAAAEVDLPDLLPRLDLAFARGVLSPRGQLELDLTASNLPGVRLRAWRVHDNNLVAHVRGTHARETARELASREIALSLERNVATDLALDLRALTGGLTGVYRVEVDATDESWAADSALVTITDLALVAKRQPDALFVWVASLADGRPVEGARVESWSYNGQLLAGARTGADGCARLEVLPAHPDGAPFVVLAAAGEDTAFLAASDFALDGGALDLSGRAPSRELDVLLFAARDVHRPGDDVHLTGIVRDAAGATPPLVELLLRGQRPDGRLIAPRPVRASGDGQGLFQQRLPTGQDDPTGPWRFWVTRRDEGTVLGEAFVLVEPFVPVRLEVEARAGSPLVLAPDAIVAEVEARYLIGRLGQGLPASLGGTLVPRPHRSASQPGFTFEDPPARASVPVVGAESALDAQGRAELRLALPEGLVGSYDGRLAATVREEGGRSVSAQVPVVVDAARRHLGLRLPAGERVAAAEPFEVEWVQLDARDAPASGSGHVELLRIDSRWEQRSTGGRLVWTRIEQELPVSRSEIGADDRAAGRLELECPTPGSYAVRGTDAATGLVTELRLWAGEAGDLPPATDAPDRIAVDLERERYAPGETARVRLGAPFAGTLLLTLEGERLLAHRVLEVPAGESEVELELPRSLRGGAFVAATLVRPVGLAEPSWLPHRAVGLARLVADHGDRRLPLALEAPARAAPGERVAIEIDAGAPRDPQRPALVQLWGVDEGILLAGGSTTPDPFEHFLGPRRASVESAQTWGELLPDVQRAASVVRIGGDGEEDELLRRRRSPVPARRREAAVLVLDAAAVDAAGRARFELELPELTGALRLMAVAVDGDAYGCADARLTLSTPITAEATWPRAVAPGDRFEVPLVLFNSSGERLAAQVAVELDGPLELEDEPRPVQLEPGGAQRLVLRARALEAGPVNAVVRARAQLADGRPLEARSSAELVVRPASVLHTESRWSRVEAGQTLTLAPEAGFERDGLAVEVSVGPRPEVELRPVLRALVDYPHGCVEQTSSRLLALLHAPAASDEASGGELYLALVDERLRAGLAHLASMQTRSGGLAYWPGGREPSLWGSAYAASVLARARRRDIALEPSLVEPLLGYLERELAHARDDLDLQAEVCAALAAFQRPDESWMSYLGEQSQRLDLTGRAHLAQAWLDAGRRERALAVLGQDALQLTTQRTTGGRLVSPVRAHAALLDTLLALDPEHPWVKVLVERLQAARRERRWDTTLSMAGALAALSSYQELDLAPSRYEGLLRGADGATHEVSSAATTTLRLPGATLPLELETQGSGPVHVAFSVEGRAAGPVEAYDRGLELRRRWLGADGRELEPGTRLRSGDLVRCELTLRTLSPTQGTVHNVAIVDALPGGLEVESPHLATSAVGRRAASAPGGPDRAEFLDDRVLVFTSAGEAPRSFGYALRAVAVGEFALPAVQAACMYDPGIASVHGGGTLRVER